MNESQCNILTIIVVQTCVCVCLVCLTYLFSGSGVVIARVTQHILSGMHLLSPWGDREGWVVGLVGSDEEGKVMGGLPMRGDSGGGVSQPISDTGEPFLTYGVASRMYLTGSGK